jgi:hypothetical protein
MHCNRPALRVEIEVQGLLKIRISFALDAADCKRGRSSSMTLLSVGASVQQTKTMMHFRYRFVRLLTLVNHPGFVCMQCMQSTDFPCTFSGAHAFLQDRASSPDDVSFLVWSQTTISNNPATSSHVKAHRMTDNGGDSKAPPALPASLRSMLTVTPRPSALGAWVTDAVAPSALVSRLEAFLPQLAAANAALPDAPGAPCVEIKHKGADGAESEEESEEESENSDAGFAGVADHDDPIAHEGDEEAEEEDEGCETKPVRAPGKAVHMDLYVDAALGELVPRDEDAAPTKPLIEVLRASKEG